MTNEEYDLAVRDAKHKFSRIVAELKLVKGQLTDTHWGALASAREQLNSAWSQLAQAVVREREERDNVIADLIDQLAESKKR